GPGAVAQITLGDLTLDLREVGGRAARDQLVVAAPGADVDAGGQEELGLRVREHHGADVSSFQHCATPGPGLALHVEQRLAHRGHRRHLACALAHVRLADRQRHVFAAQLYGKTARFLVAELDRVLFHQLPSELTERPFRIPGHARALRGERHRAVQRASVDQQVAEFVSDAQRHGRLACPRRPVDGHNWPASHRCTSMFAPSARKVPANRGKLTAKQSTSSMVDSPSASKPSNAAVIATRWSPPQFTWAAVSARSGCPSITIPSGRAVAWTPKARKSSLSAAMRSVSSSRSSATSLTSVTPRARAASAQITGSSSKVRSAISPLILVPRSTEPTALTSPQGSPMASPLGVMPMRLPKARNTS